MKHSLIAGAVASALAASSGAATAQQTIPPQDVNPPKEVKATEKITVTASPLDRPPAEMAQPVTVLSDEELRRKRAASIGDTLAQEPGVQSSAFGAGAGRPIIRGLDGPRIRVLENGIGTGDASSVSPDHAVTTESLRAEQIEILRGPASLLYGSGAIGGVVNVVSKTIPRERVDGLAGAAEGRMGSANRERTLSADLDAGAGDLALHADAFKRRTRDYDTPLGRLAGSDVDMRGGGLGASWVGARGFAGLGAQRLENDYGVPSGEGVRIRMKQERLEAAAEASAPLPGFSRLRFRAGRNDYRHVEVEPSGEIGTTFENKATEARLELRHEGTLRGTVGAQVQHRELSALGEEAILPRTRARAAALFLVEEKDFGSWSVDAGIRVERETRKPDLDLPEREFTLATPALGLVFKLPGDHRFSVSATQAQRAPSVEELYSSGAHHATATFDQGNPALRKEVSRNVDVTFSKVAGDARWRVNLYANRIGDYVFAANVDADGDGVADRVDDEGALDPEGEFLLQRYAQATARFRGVEAEWGYRPAGGWYGVRLFGDLTRGRLAGGGNLPRIAPARAGFNADGTFGNFSASLTVIHAFAQKRVAALESATPAYTRVDAELAWRVETAKARAVTLFLQGTNLADEVIRIHSSYLKDVAPQMGRSFTVGVRAELP